MRVYRTKCHEQDTVINDVFKAVEGCEAVALHVPIFKGSVFKGSIGIPINFERPNAYDRFDDFIAMLKSARED